MANEKRCDWSVTSEGSEMVRCQARGAGKNGGKDWSHIKVVTSRETGGSGAAQTVQVLDICPEHAHVLAGHLSVVPVRR